MRKIGAVFVVVCCVLFVGVAGAEAYESPGTAVVGYSFGPVNNGYIIVNDTSEDLVREGEPVQRAGSTCQSNGECTVYGEGFAVESPRVISPGGSAYFEVPAYTYSDVTLDNTRVSYRAAGTGRVVIVHANVEYYWAFGIGVFQDDHSSCAAAHDLTCVLTRSAGHGSQTVFRVS